MLHTEGMDGVDGRGQDHTTAIMTCRVDIVGLRGGGLSFGLHHLYRDTQLYSALSRTKCMDRSQCEYSCASSRLQRPP